MEAKEKSFKYHCCPSEKVSELCEAMKKINLELFNAENIDENLAICNITSELENQELISFSFNYRETESDSWLQVEFYSKKLNKTIIMDYDAPSYFNNDDNPDFPAGVKFAEILADYQSQCEKLEESITINK
jgi:hypothetical protein